MLRLLRCLLRNRSGQGLPEYALLVAAVVVVVVSCAFLFRGELSTVLGTVGTRLQEEADGMGGGRSRHAPGHGNTPPGQGGVPPGQIGP